ncbi:18364_t:CDS:2 [Dentiscutata erythropus]|uniref:18364_t:CDS:1 n=1 Tax=Dentiscutata erythropus TaxID=1348616 RepID=A0A9N9NF22_9GLOM|nr:18364_t:CDS:2 [Dentiscutata erythropus]
MTASVKEDLKIDNEDIVINVSTKNYVEQDYIDLKLTCYYPTSIYYLTNTTAIIKKDSVVYVNRELIITNDDNISTSIIAQTIATRVKEST